MLCTPCNIALPAMLRRIGMAAGFRRVRDGLAGPPLEGWDRPDAGESACLAPGLAAAVPPPPAGGPAE
jgi:hypothetical protein